MWPHLKGKKTIRSKRMELVGAGKRRRKGGRRRGRKKRRGWIKGRKRTGKIQAERKKRRKGGMEADRQENPQDFPLCISSTT